MPTLIGTIPEDLPLNSSYQFTLGTTLPEAIVGRRPLFDELIWDADGGFSPEWRGRSSLSGDGSAGNPYVMLVQRSAYSIADVALFRFDAGGSTAPPTTLAGDVTGAATATVVTGIQGFPVAVPAVAGRVATFDGDSVEWIAPTVPAPPAAVYYQGYSLTAVQQAGTVWTDINTVCTLTDGVANGITRSGSIFTFAQAGVYRGSFAVNQGIVSTALGWSMRLRNVPGAVTLLTHNYYGGPVNIGPTFYMTGVFQATAGMTATLQACRKLTAGPFGTDTYDGEPSRTVNISFERIGS